jgi:hypothetical protein
VEAFSPEEIFVLSRTVTENGGNGAVWLQILVLTSEIAQCGALSSGATISMQVA